MALAAVEVACGGEAHAQESTLDAYRSASRANPGDPAAALAYGRALRRAGHVPEALSELHRGLAVGASKPDVAARLHWEVTRAYADRHDLPRATASCKELERKTGGGPGAPVSVPTTASHGCVAVAYLSWQRATEALSEAQAALDKDPTAYDAKVAEGRAYELQLKPTDAEAAFRAALAMRGDNEDAHVALGRVLSKEGKRDEGVAELRHALQLDPADPEALFELGSALAPGAESLTFLDRATRERPAFPEAWLALGTQQLTANDLAVAKDAADAAVKSDPGSVAALVLAGKVALAQGRVDDALRSGQAALKIVPNNAAAVLLVADGDARKGDIDAALEAYQSAWGLDHGDPAPLVRASEACHAATRDTSARAFGAKAAQEFPNWAPAWAALGDALVGQKEAQAARDAYRKALAVPDGSIDRASVSQKLAALR
ncbi:MAG TPA: tetratricopeptide repeat protein [Polyangiaceae bacterium]|nr:tetratricopeptide repeat protein [Polyangiaceae bacterium]